MLLSHMSFPKGLCEFSIKSKKVFSKFQKFKNLDKTQVGKIIKLLKTNNDGDCCSQECGDLLKT
jgi:hypothetical protein